jgi:Abnormal spindle-like microcephaly-assoc'd, ASPM-SPD-2-Hydin
MQSRVARRNRWRNITLQHQPKNTVVELMVHAIGYAEIQAVRHACGPRYSRICFIQVLGGDDGVIRLEVSRRWPSATAISCTLTGQSGRRIIIRVLFRPAPMKCLLEFRGVACNSSQRGVHRFFCETFFRKTSQIVAVCVLYAIGATSSNAQTFTISPTSLAFGTQTVGTFSHNTVTLLNTGTTNLTLNSFTLSPSQFRLVNGYAPAVLGKKRAMYFTIEFAPDSAQLFGGQLTINIQGVSPQVVPLSGQGLTTSAIATLSASAMDFGTVVQGTSSATQSLKVTNTGASSLKLLSVNADPPFTVSGFSSAVTLKAGASTTLTIAMAGASVGSFPGEVTLSFDVLPTRAVSLSGTVVASSTFAISTFPTLPSASTGAPYLANLMAIGGTAPYTWTLAQGSALPPGLVLTGVGSISGTIASSQPVGSYPFSVQVSDSSFPVKTASATLGLPIATAPALPDCNNIVYPNLSAPLIPINDLGAGTYLGEEGGLYPNGSNVRPAEHDAAGVSIAQSIQPLDANGNVDPNGKYVLISVGNSETQQEFLQFLTDAGADPSTSPHLVIVNGAQDALVASDWANITSGAWSTLSTVLLPQAGVTANQVVAAWIKAFDIPSGTFPADEAATQADLESIAQNLHTLFPNIKLAYYASRIYGGYGNTTQSTQDGEPNSYQTGFPIKWAIQDQIDGLATLNFDPAQGAVRAPWMSWEAYDWANGMLARSDGLVWTCQDFLDGGHPSAPAGREKDANLFLSFLKTDDSTRPWFLNPAQLVLLSKSSLAFGSQALGTTSAAQSVTVTNNQAIPLSVSTIAATGDFAQKNNCGLTVAAGGKCKVSVTFTPTAVGTRTGSLTITDDAASSPQIVSLSGTGVN